MIKEYSLSILMTCTIIGCVQEVPTKNSIVDIENELRNNNFQVCNLSSFGGKIQYIPLETNEKSLIGRAKTIFFEKNNIYIQDDQQNVIHRFDQAGKYMGIIGSEGGGSEEYEGHIYFSYIDIIPQKKEISFITNSFIQYFYTLEGEYLRRMKLPKIKEHVTMNSLQLSKNIFLCDLTCIMQTKYNYLIYNDSLSKITHTEEELHPISKYNESFSTYDMAAIWRYKDQLRYHKRMDNIIYSFQKNAIKDTLYMIQYGKYRIIKPDISQDQIVKNSIYMHYAVETDKYIYLQFNFNKWAPESIKEVIKRPGRATKIVTINTVCAVFNKSSYTLQLLKHPVKNSLGLYNDIDGGLPFWPQYISPDGEMIMYYNAEKFIEIYNNLDNPSPALTKVMESINEDSNPVVVLVR